MSLYTDQLVQLFQGATWDGNLLSKFQRDRLVKDGLAERVAGWNIITPDGVRYIISIGMPVAQNEEAR